MYFAAILTGLAEFTESGPTAVAFIVGVGLASFGWQVLLVALGAGLRRRTGPSFRKGTAVVGNGLIVAFGVALIIQTV